MNHRLRDSSERLYGSAGEGTKALFHKGFSSVYTLMTIFYTYPEPTPISPRSHPVRHEAATISARTKAALDAAKARGVKLGNPANLCRQLDDSAKGNAAKADKRAADLLPLILPIKAGGASLRQIADGLNRCGVPAPRGGDWSAVAVKRILDRQVRQTAASV